MSVRIVAKKPVKKSISRSAGKPVLKNKKSIVKNKRLFVKKPVTVLKNSSTKKPQIKRFLIKSSSLAKSAKQVMMPKMGTLAPDFSLPDSNGTLVSLRSYRGKKVVLYFYPKDDTPGCTIEAQEFRDDYDVFLAQNAVVIGISKDACDRHRAFIQKYDLNFILLSDVAGSVVQKYGCWIEKSLYGRKYMGIARATFIIDEKGIVKKVFPKVTPNGHSKEVLQEL